MKPQKPKPAAALLDVLIVRGLTLYQCAALLESRGYGRRLQSLEAWSAGGAYNPTAGTLAALADVLGCQVAEIMPASKSDAEW